MESNRAQTLEALSTFIQAQTDVLAKTQRDIDRLKQLKEEVEHDKTLSSEDLLSKSGPFKLSERVNEIPEPSKDLDWSLFRGLDTSQIKALGASWKEQQNARYTPLLYQRSKLSPLQKFVKDARRIIAEPILEQFALMSAPELSSDEEPDPEVINREIERAKIRELKKRKIACSLTVPFRARGPNGVFIRRDIEDESGHVDISADENTGSALTKPRSPPPDVQPMGVDSKPQTKTRVPSPSAVRDNSHGRVRRPTAKAKSQTLETSTPKATRRRGSAAKPALATTSREKTPVQEPETPIKGSESKQSLGKRSRDAGKPKSETYKQAWSVSEQHLLERLLVEIPDGEKNRWQKISKAMNGHRTPRQVASRVQKYFEKLKRFGVDVN